MLGCVLVLLLIVAISRRVSTITLLIFGLMLGYLAQGFNQCHLTFYQSIPNQNFCGLERWEFCRRVLGAFSHFIAPRHCRPD